MSIFKAIFGKTGDSNYQVPRIDASTHTLQTIDYAHHEVHSGSHYFYQDSVELGSGGVQNYLITVPDSTSWPHMTFTMDGLAITQFDLYEDTDKSGSVDASSKIFNNNRNSSNVAGVTIAKGLTGGTTDGTLIKTYKDGSSSGGSKTSSSTREGEVILKQNTKYILRVTSGTAANLTNVKLEWYEHTNKTA